MLQLLIHLSNEADKTGNDPSTFGEWITPWLPVVVIAVGSILVGLFNAHNRRKGNVETRAPDVNEIWSQQAAQSMELDNERKLRRRIENYAWELMDVWKHYVHRVQRGGSVDLTPHESLFYNSEPPTAEIKTK